MKKALKSILLVFISILMITSTGFAEEIVDNSDTENSEIPSYFNAVDEGWVTPVKFQNPWGTCWTFAAMSAAETSAIKKGSPLSTTEFSEKSLSYFASQLQGSRNTPVNMREGTYLTTGTGELVNTLSYQLGGNTLYTAGQLMTWNGLNSLAEVPYSNNTGDFRVSGLGPMPSPIGNWTVSYGEGFSEYYHVNNCAGPLFIEFGKRLTEVEDTIDIIKESVYNYGSTVILCNVTQQASDGTVYPFLNPETYAQYTPVQLAADHAMTIVGYDDNYAVDNFKEGVQPPAPGAYIVKNSWSSNWGNEGYMYISYYDEAITGIINIDADTPESGSKYNNNYEYDYLSTKKNQDYYFLLNFLYQDKQVENQYSYANLFVSERSEILKAVTGVVTYPAQAVFNTKVYVNRSGSNNWELVDDQTDTFDNSVGINEIVLENEVELNEGDLFTVVQTLNYYNVTPIDLFGAGMSDEAIPVVPAYNIEMGIEDYDVMALQNPYGETVGYANQYSVAQALPGESFILGIGENPTEWYDVTDPSIQSYLRKDTIAYNAAENVTTLTTTVPGNAEIKAFTTNVNEEPDATNIQLTTKEILLSSAVSSTRRGATVNAVLTPADATANITWESEFPTVASVEGEGTSAKIVALAEGETTITATLPNGNSASVEVVVSNQTVVAGSVQIISETPDYYTISVINPTTNPLVDEIGTIRKVSIFTWSADDMSDLDCKVATLDNGVYTYTFPVNNNAEHEYYDKADQIYINIYGSINSENDGNLISAGTYSWLNLQNALTNDVGYISYGQNIGFNQPTVFDGETAGMIDDPDSKHIEGLRISSNYGSAAAISTAVYEEGKGWQAPVEDGEYAGTMHQDRALEAIKLDLYGSYSSMFKLSYRVYQDGAWTSWVKSGEQAGVSGQGMPIEAIEVTLDLDI